MLKRMKNKWYRSRIKSGQCWGNGTDHAREGCKAAYPRGQVTVPLMPADVIEKRKK